MDERERERGRGDRGEHTPPRVAHRDEHQRERGRDEQLPARGGRQLEHAVRAAAARGQRDRRRGGRRHGRPQPPRAEERRPRLVGDEQRQGREPARLVEHDRGRVDAREPRDRGEERVPDRERVAGVEPAVGELPEPGQRERVELGELPHPPEVEQRVPLDPAGDLPQRDPEQEPGPGDRDGSDVEARGLRGSEPQATRHDDADGRRRHGHEDEPEAGVEHDRGGEPDRHRRQRPHERAGRRRDPQRPRGEDPRQERDERGRAEAEPEPDAALRKEPDEEQRDQRAGGEPHRSSSAGTEPDRSQRDVSAYVRPRSPRNSAPRSASAPARSRRARSA